MRQSKFKILLASIAFLLMLCTFNNVSGNQEKSALFLDSKTDIPAATTSQGTATPEPNKVVGDPSEYVILNNIAGKYLPTKKDCNIDDGYILPKNGYSPLTNEEIISRLGVKQGRKYVIETDRKTGWEVEYLNNSNLTKPRRIVVLAEMYLDSKGALLAFKNYSPIKLEPELGWEIAPNEFDVSTHELTLIRKDNLGSKDEFWHYHFDFSYHNYRVSMLFEGSVSQMDFEFIRNIVNKTKTRLKQEKLYPIHPQPTPTYSNDDGPLIECDPSLLILDSDDLTLLGDYGTDPVSEIYFYGIDRQIYLKFNDPLVSNLEIIKSWGVKDGREYVIKSSRQTGWSETYYSYEYRYNVNQRWKQFWNHKQPAYTPYTSPILIVNSVSIYKSIEGAREAFIKLIERNHPANDSWVLLPEKVVVGDKSQIFTRKEVSSGQLFSGYEIFFISNNVISSIHVLGSGDTISIKSLQKLARIQNKKIFTVSNELDKKSDVIIK
jgi:hypothetical protein